MGQSLSVFLVRAAGLVLSGMLLFAAFGHAHAQDGDNYGLKRFSGDNYDTLPPGAGIAPVPAPQGFAPVQGSGASANGYYTTLNGSVSDTDGSSPAPNNVAPPIVTVSSPPAFQQTNQPQASQSAPGYQPAQTLAAPQAAAPSSESYGYKPLGPALPAYPVASIPATKTDPNSDNHSAANGGRENVDYVLGPGDKLRLTVFGETDLSGEFTVDGSGFVRLPLIGQVHAAGYTSPQLEAAIGSALAQGYLRSPRVSVEVSTYRPFYIIGAVNRPGQYPFIDHMNALNAIALAGGFTQGAVESVVFVRREGSNQEVEIPADRTSAIYPGDVVRVHNTIFTDAMNLFQPFTSIAASAATAAVIQ
jgi:protein involved in polysaccharide export with SLBB domain